MASDDNSVTALWDDNPSRIDLLGFDAVVAPIVDAVRNEQLDPLTVGVHAHWGGGKSTVLGLIESELKSDLSIAVVPTNPWQYDDHDDVKGTLISEVLDELQRKFKDDADLKVKFKELLTRISWSRVGRVVAKGAIMQTVNLGELAEALTPKGRDSPESMSGFKSAFADLVKALPGTTRVVVLVDDLDRCLPKAVTATLEAIKLFLSVPGMVFVLAADQEMVRDAIAMNLGASVESSRYAQRYLDKIIQLPVSLPVLPAHEAEAYVGLLLARYELEDDEFESLVDHVRNRRQEGRAHFLSEMDDLVSPPSGEVLSLASQLVLGLRSDKVVNPREIKRFLNAYQVRSRIADVRGLEIRPDVLAKLLLLEDRFGTDFGTLLSKSEAERKVLLKQWAGWGRGDEGIEKPEGVTEESRDWAAARPDISTEAIGPYLSLAASFASRSQVVGAIDAEVAALIHDLSGGSEAVRRTAVTALVARSEEDQRIAIEGLLADARLRNAPAPTILSLIQIAEQTSQLTQEVATGIKENCWKDLDVGTAVALAASANPVLQSAAQELVDDEEIDDQVRQAARGIIDDRPV